MTGWKNTPITATQLIVEGAHVEKKQDSARTDGGGGAGDNLFFEINFQKQSPKKGAIGRKPNKIKDTPCLDMKPPK